MAIYYFTATSRQRGALGIFHAYGDEVLLATQLDRRVGPRSGARVTDALVPDELRYGWLSGNDATAIDEVMLAKPREGFRVLMTHGGEAVREAVEGFMRGAGFVRLEEAPDGHEQAERVDPLYDPVLAGCVTEAQVAAVLHAREKAARDGGKTTLPDAVMAVHRIVLAGPPNAGKSSLLNCLSGYERAFVDEEAGATRDVVDELVDLGGYAVHLGDLPGFPDENDEVSREAWRRAAERIRQAEWLWFVCDASRAWNESAAPAAREVMRILRQTGNDGMVRPPPLIILNKSDLPPGFSGDPWKECFPDSVAVRLCSLPEGNAPETLEKIVFAAWGAECTSEGGQGRG